MNTKNSSDFNWFALVSFFLGILACFTSPWGYPFIVSFIYDGAERAAKIESYYYGGTQSILWKSVIIGIIGLIIGVVSLKYNKAQRIFTVIGIILSIVASLAPFLLLLFVGTW